MSAYQDMLKRFEHNHGDKFDPSDLDPRFRQFYGTGARTGVRWVGTDAFGLDFMSEPIEYGTVGITTGWKPAFLLIHRSSDRGSSTVLTERYRIVKVKYQGARAYRDFLPADDLSAKTYT